MCGVTHCNQLQYIRTVPTFKSALIFINLRYLFNNFSRPPLLFFSSTTSLLSSPFNLLCVYVNPALLPCTINLPSIIFSAKTISKQQSSRSLQGFHKGFKIYMAHKWILHAVFLSFGMCNKQIKTWKFLLKYLGVFSLSKPANFSFKLGLFWMEINEKKKAPVLRCSFLF